MDLAVVIAAGQRGGSSRSVFFHAEALPADRSTPDAMRRALRGSPDAIGRPFGGVALAERRAGHSAGSAAVCRSAWWLTQGSVAARRRAGCYDTGARRGISRASRKSGGNIR